MHFCFFRIWFWTWQHDPFHTKIDKFSFVFKESCCLWVFSPRIWNAQWMHFSQKNLLHQLKNEEMTQKQLKSIFSVLIFGGRYAESKHTGLSFKLHFNRSIFKFAIWVSGIVSVLQRALRGSFGSSTFKLFCFVFYYSFNVYNSFG